MRAATYSSIAVQCTCSVHTTDGPLPTCRGVEAAAHAVLLAADHQRAAGGHALALGALYGPHLGAQAAMHRCSAESMRVLSWSAPWGW